MGDHFGLTLLADSTVAVEVGIMLAALLYSIACRKTRGFRPWPTPQYKSAVNTLPPYVSTVWIYGPFLFGTTDKLAAETADLNQFAPVVVLRLRDMTAIDATGLHALETFSDRLHKAGKTLLLCGAREQRAQLIERSELSNHIGKENILPHAEAALLRAKEIAEDFDGVAEDIAKEYRDHAPL